jgi:hypothetical protein
MVCFDILFSTCSNKSCSTSLLQDSTQKGAVKIKPPALDKDFDSPVFLPTGLLKQHHRARQTDNLQATPERATLCKTTLLHTYFAESPSPLFPLVSAIIITRSFSLP